MKAEDIKIVEAYETDKPAFDFSKLASELLAKPPAIDLRGIGKVVIVGFARSVHEHEKTSLLHPKLKDIPIFIELCASRILEAMPEAERADAEAVKAHTAYAIFRAVGYNTLQYKHGVDKKKADAIAMSYGRKLLSENFPGWTVENDLPVKK
jgi:hypothetical protein